MDKILRYQASLGSGLALGISNQLNIDLKPIIKMSLGLGVPSLVSLINGYIYKKNFNKPDEELIETKDYFQTENYETLRLDLIKKTDTFTIENRLNEFERVSSLYSKNMDSIFLIEKYEPLLYELRSNEKLFSEQQLNKFNDISDLLINNPKRIDNLYNFIEKNLNQSNGYLEKIYSVDLPKQSQFTKKLNETLAKSLFILSHGLYIQNQSSFNEKQSDLIESKISQIKEYLDKDFDHVNKRNKIIKEGKESGFNNIQNYNLFKHSAIASIPQFLVLGLGYLGGNAVGYLMK